jgi:hypothetical protein
MPYGRKKLKDMFIEKGIPQSIRDRLPLLAFNSQVLWIPGVAKALGPLDGEMHCATPHQPGQRHQQQKHLEILCWLS